MKLPFQEMVTAWSFPKFDFDLKIATTSETVSLSLILILMLQKKLLDRLEEGVFVVCWSYQNKFVIC